MFQVVDDLFDKYEAVDWNGIKEVAEYINNLVVKLGKCGHGLIFCLIEWQVEKAANCFDYPVYHSGLDERAREKNIMEMSHFVTHLAANLPQMPKLIWDNLGETLVLDSHIMSMTSFQLIYQKVTERALPRLQKKVLLA